jgi:hypothetical protein
MYTCTTRPVCTHISTTRLPCVTSIDCHLIVCIAHVGAATPGALVVHSVAGIVFVRTDYWQSAVKTASRVSCAAIACTQICMHRRLVATRLLFVRCSLRSPTPTMCVFVPNRDCMLGHSHLGLHSRQTWRARALDSEYQCITTG